MDQATANEVAQSAVHITHREQVQSSSEFHSFVGNYALYFPGFKDTMYKLAHREGGLDPAGLLGLYHVLTDPYTERGERILDFLRCMEPDESCETYRHLLNSALVAGVYAGWTGLESVSSDTLILSAFLYDIGKLTLPQELFTKKEKLTDLEFAQIKTHTIQGFEILKDLPGISDSVLHAVLGHHERCDGQGYPSHLKMDQIDMYSRYISIIDSYIAMTSPRSYRKPLLTCEIVDNYETAGMLQYDYEILAVFLRHLADTTLGTTVRLSDSTYWEVTLLNAQRLARPMLRRPGADSDTEYEFLDLAKNPQLQIIAEY